MSQASTRRRHLLGWAGGWLAALLATSMLAPGLALAAPAIE